MKKALIFSFILILSLVSLFAMTSAGSTFNGFSGIPIGSIYYQGGPWNQNGEESVPNSSDNEMIALISFWGITDTTSREKPFTVSISCPNGMYMTSISNPTFKRPFEIEFNPSFKKDGTTKREDGFKLSNDNPVYQYIMNKDYDNFWFDVVVCLPVKDLG